MTQQQFDFNRAVQLRTLELLDVKTLLAGKGVKNAAAIKAVLKAIDSYQRTSASCHPSIATLAHNTGLSTNTVRRVLHRLASLDWIVLEERKRPDGSYTSHNISIRWVRLLDLVPATDDREALRPRPGGTPNMGGGTPNMGGGYSQGGSSQHKRTSNRPKKRHSMCAESVGSSQRKFWGRAQPLTRAELRTPAIVASLFTFALERGWGGLTRSEADRRKFFALCQHAARKGKNPGEYLTYLLREELYGNITGLDDDAAEELLRRERGPAGTVARSLGAVFQPAVAAAAPAGGNDAWRAELQRRAQNERTNERR